MGRSDRTQECAAAQAPTCAPGVRQYDESVHESVHGLTSTCTSSVMTCQSASGSGSTDRAEDLIGPGARTRSGRSYSPVLTTTMVTAKPRSVQRRTMDRCHLRSWTNGGSGGACAAAAPACSNDQSGRRGQRASVSHRGRGLAHAHAVATWVLRAWTRRHQPPMEAGDGAPWSRVFARREATRVRW
jgi:hypothetical protein